MYWPDTNTGVDIEPARKPVASAVRKFFSEGGAGQPPTVPGGDWFNQITNELLNVLAAAGIDPSKTDDDQLLQAINGISKALSAREALRRTYVEAGYTLVPGSFELGGTVTTATDVLLYETDGKAYSFSGTLPHTVGNGSAPGDEPGMWVDKSPETLRNALSDQGGSARVGFIQSGSGATPRTAQDKMREDVTPADFGATGNGIDLDQVAFDAIELAFSGVLVDLQNRTYAVTSMPSNNKYANGQFKIGSFTWSSPYIDFVRAWDTPLNADGPGAGVIAIGTNAAGSMSDDHAETYKSDVIAIGRDALALAPRGSMNIAIGANAMGKAIPGAANIAIGAYSLTNVQGNPGSVSGSSGSRNIGIGSLSGHFLTTGYRNILIGRDAGHSLETGIHNVAVGYRALAVGHCPVGLTGQIENQEPAGPTGANVAVGFNALSDVVEGSNVAIGSNCLPNMTKGTGNVFIGALAGEALSKNISARGKVISNVTVNGTYSQSGTTITISAVATGVVAGNRCELTFTSGAINAVTAETQRLIVASVIDANTFTVTSPVTLTASGNVTVTRVETATAAPAIANQCVAIGYQANYLAETQGGNSVFVGQGTGQSSTGAQCTMVGSRAGFNATTGTLITALGYNAARALTTGGGLTTESNVTCIGANAGISGSNQVQLGDAATTTYVYGTVQNRSDERDKADLRPTTLGDEFIDGLEAEEGFWDMRDDYLEEYQVQVGIDLETAEPVFESRFRQLPKDGSKKRNRRHQWFVAQKIKALCEELGIDFGGLQDHSVNGGCDVMSLGYDEFIPPLTAYVQRRKAEIRALEGIVSRQEEVLKNMEQRLKALEGGA